MSPASESTDQRTALCLAERGETVVADARLFRRPLGQLRGWIGRKPDPQLAIGLAPCRRVHTFFVAFPLDILYCDDAGRVLARETLAPWRIGASVFGARLIWEAIAGTFAKIRVGETVSLCP